MSEDRTAELAGWLRAEIEQARAALLAASNQHAGERGRGVGFDRGQAIFSASAAARLVALGEVLERVEPIP